MKLMDGQVVHGPVPSHYALLDLCNTTLPWGLYNSATAIFRDPVLSKASSQFEFRQSDFSRAFNRDFDGPAPVCSAIRF